MDAAAFKELLESLDCCVVQLGNAGFISYCSPQIESLTGFSTDQIIGKNICELVLRDDDWDAGLDLPLMISLHKPIRKLAIRMMGKKGQVIRAELTLTFFHSDTGLPLGYRGFIQKSSNPANLVSEQMSWVEALENIIEAVVMVDNDFRITYANKNFYDLFDYEPVDIIQKPMSVMNCPEEHESLQPMAIVEAINIQGYWQGEVKRRAKFGNYIPVLLNARPYMDSKGKHKGFIGTYLDLRTVNSSEIKTKRALINVIQAIMVALDGKLSGREGYLQRMSDLSVAIGLELGLDNKALEGLRLGALLHDLGKFQIPQEIVTKKINLNAFEQQFFKEHTSLGSDIIKHLFLPWPVAQMILQHHERMDGSGYPQGLTGDDILLEARIIAVVDSLEAACLAPQDFGLTNLDLPLKVLEKGKGILFDPVVVDTCIKLVRTGQFPEFLTLDRSGSEYISTRRVL